MQPHDKSNVDPAHRRFGLLAHAIAGKPVSLAFVNGSNRYSYADSERIYLVKGREPETRRLEIMVQAALIAGQSLERKELLKLVGKKNLRSRYLLLEVQRCCRELEDRLPRAFIESLRQYQTGHEPMTSGDSLEIAHSISRLPRPPEWFGTIRPWKLLRSGQPGGRSRISDQRLKQLESRINRVDQDEDEDEDSLEKTSFWEKFTSPLGRDSFLSRLMKEALDMKTSPQTDSSDSGTTMSSEMVSTRMLRRARDVTNAVKSALPAAMLPSFAQEDTNADCYPEWDYRTKQYRPDWTRVEEVHPSGQGERASKVTPLQCSDREMQRQLARICLSYQRHRGVSLGDDLVLDRLINLAVDLKSGHSGDDRIYTTNLKTKRDLAVQILLDASSSTLEHADNGYRVIDAQLLVARKLCRAFSMLGDRIAMHAFHSWGPKVVRFQILKNFHEQHVQGLDHRLKKLSVAGYTRCGAAIRHAVQRLETQAGTPFQLMILISDGYAYDDQYEGEYAINDTRKAIEEARSKGIAVVCVSVGSDAGDKQLARLYGKANYTSLNTPDRLPSQMGKLVTKALTLAQADAGSNKHCPAN